MYMLDQLILAHFPQNAKPHSHSRIQKAESLKKSAFPLAKTGISGDIYCFAQTQNSVVRIQ